MHVVYAQEAFPQEVTKTIFLAGPSPRNADHENWREKALELLELSGFDGHVLIPLPRDGKFGEYDAQVAWEWVGLRRADVILFWVPRDVDALPGFTTNIEWGDFYRRQPNIILGYPEEAPKMRYLQYGADAYQLQSAHQLDETIALAIRMIGDGAVRVGGQCEVPLFLWKLPHFQNWVQSQIAAGNRLDGCNVELAFRVGPEKRFVFIWAAHVNVYVAAEGRNKTNEIVISRPDVMHVVGLSKAESGHPLDTTVVLVREFRSPARTADGFIRETPGGSGANPDNPLEEASKELHEETGLRIDVDRFLPLDPRQLAGTLSAHQAFVYFVALTPEEVGVARALEADGTALGEAYSSERTYIEVWTVRDLLDQSITDWANLGMIFAAIAKSGWYE